jgi:hypothetical protein
LQVQCERQRRGFAASVFFLFGRGARACWGEHARAAAGILPSKVRPSNYLAVQRHACGTPWCCEHGTARVHFDSSSQRVAT